MVKNFEEKIKNGNKIFQMIRLRQFKGNLGQAVKNSSYQLSTVIFSRVCALIFTIIIARLLMPELFGLYSLALSTILLFASFSDLGVGYAAITFISKKLSEDKYSKANGYYIFLLRFKIALLIIISSLLIISSYFVSNFYYNKPIFYALLAGALYIPLMDLTGFFTNLFVTMDNFRMGLVKEIIFQISRLVLIPLAILIFIGKFNDNLFIATIILSLAISYLFSLSFTYRNFKKTKLKRAPFEKLTPKESSEIKWFMAPLTVTALSGSFFGSIDIIMLGHYVSSEFLGYYQAAFSLILAASAILAFAGNALFPIMSRLEGTQLENGFRKSLKITFLITILAGIFTYFAAETIISIAYGQEYSSAVTLLKLFSLILFSAPLISLYSTYYISQKHAKEYAILLVFSTILNIILNYVLITNFLSRGMLDAVVGAGIATVISRGVYLITLIIFRKK